jgi:hypothetical protein
MDEQKAQAVGRTPEEVAWDEEFADIRRSSLGSDLRGAMLFAAKAPRALIRVPMRIVPEETTRHARAAALESFLAVRSVLSAIGDSIENVLAGSDLGTDRPPTLRGPEGTWGTGVTSGSGSGSAAGRGGSRTAPTPTATSSGKVKHIEVSDTDPIEPATGPGDLPC